MISLIAVQDLKQQEKLFNFYYKQIFTWSGNNNVSFIALVYYSFIGLSFDLWPNKHYTNSYFPTWAIQTSSWFFIWSILFPFSFFNNDNWCCNQTLLKTSKKYLLHHILKFLELYWLQLKPRHLLKLLQLYLWNKGIHS